MRANFLMPMGSVLLLLLAATTPATGQPPASGKGPPGLPNDESEILKEIREAYKAPFEVHEDVLKELRRAYQQPTPEREAKIFKELRRLYALSPERETAILREVRRAYEQPSTEQEGRIFQEIARAEALPLGTVPPAVQAEQAGKLFRKFDRNGDGRLGPDEMPESLRHERARWDANRDGSINPDEYWAYHQGRLGSLSARVASGEIDLKLGNRGPVLRSVPAPEEGPRPVVYRAGQLPSGLPDWFPRLDADRDGQVGVDEWLRGRRPLKEFLAMDPDNDGFVTAEETIRYLAQQSPARPDGPTPGGTPTVRTVERR